MQYNVNHRAQVIPPPPQHSCSSWVQGLSRDSASTVQERYCPAVSPLDALNVFCGPASTQPKAPNQKCFQMNCPLLVENRDMGPWGGKMPGTSPQSHDASGWGSFKMGTLSGGIMNMRQTPSSKGEQVCTPGSTNRYTYSAFMAPPTQPNPSPPFSPSLGPAVAPSPLPHILHTCQPGRAFVERFVTCLRPPLPHSPGDQTSFIRNWLGRGSGWVPQPGWVDQKSGTPPPLLELYSGWVGP